MDVNSYTKYVRISPRKVRLVSAGVRKLTIDEALSQLSFLPKAGAREILNTLQSALNNAEKNHNLNRENLYIKNIIVEESNRLKRMDKSHGARFNRGIRLKRGCHIKVILDTKS